MASFLFHLEGLTWLLPSLCPSGKLYLLGPGRTGQRLTALVGLLLFGGKGDAKRVNAHSQCSPSLGS